MSRHKINFDAIREGARALLRSWPDEPSGPTSIPPRVHRILWEDDYWRGVTMMGEACKRAFQAETEDVGSRARGAMSIVEMHRRQLAVCRVMLGVPKPGDEDLDEDQIDVLSECWSQLSATGCIERYGPVATGDVEGEADAREEA